MKIFLTKSICYILLLGIVAACAFLGMRLVVSESYTSNHGLSKFIENQNTYVFYVEEHFGYSGGRTGRYFICGNTIEESERNTALANALPISKCQVYSMASAGELKASTHISQVIDFMLCSKTFSPNTGSDQNHYSFIFKTKDAELRMKNIVFSVPNERKLKELINSLENRGNNLGPLRHEEGSFVDPNLRTK